MKYPSKFTHKENGCVFNRSKKISADGTPRYIVNPNSDATYHISHFQHERFKPSKNTEI